jgi:PAS domain S-box-containing protein
VKRSDRSIHPQLRFGARTPRRAAVRIALIYALVGSAWIFFSDLIIGRWLRDDFAGQWHIQSLAGCIYVVVTAAMLYLLIRRAFTAVRTSAQAQRESERRARQVVERVSDYAIFTLDSAGNVTSWNRGAQQITDWADEEIKGKHFSVFYPAADVDAGKPARDLAEAMSKGWVEEEAIRVRQDGSPFWAAVQLTAVRDEDETSNGFLCVLRDITERRRAQEAFQQTSQILSTVIDCSPLAIVTLDANALVTSWNAAAERLFGWTAQEAVSQPLRIVPPDRMPLLEENNRRLLAGKRLAAMDVVGVRKDGRPAPVSLWAAPLTDADGRIVGNVRLYADVTQQKRVEEELRELTESLEARVRERTARVEEANEELQAFSYTVSHDLRIPLRSLQQIAGELLTTQQERLDDSGKAEALRIVGAAARMERHIEDLLEYSRVSRSELKLEPISLVLVVHELLGRLDRDPDFHDAQITVQEPLGWVMAHRLTLQQVILNLLVNAITFVRTGVRPMINIRATEEANMIRLCVEDNGIGINADDRERIFHIFERLPAAEQYPGIGVGLTVARRGVERMGGKITIEKSSSGGTVFCIELPKSK